MKKARVWRPAALLLASSLAFIFAMSMQSQSSGAPAQERAPTVPCWKFIQIERYAGRLVGYISDKAIKLDTVYGTLIALPDKVTVANLRTKKFCEWKSDEFDKHSKLFTHKAQKYDWPMTEWKKVGVERLAGVDADRYKRFNPQLPKSRQFFEECWVNSKATSESKLIRKFITYLRIPDFTLDRLPMAFKRTWIDETARTAKDKLEVQEDLKTLSWTRVSVPKTFFDAPKGLAKVKDEFDVVMGEGSEADPLRDLPPELKQHYSSTLGTRGPKAK